MKRVVGLLLVVLALGAGAAAATAASRLHLRLPHLAAPRARAPQPVMVDVPAITTNLADPGGGHFAQVAITVTLSGPAAANAFRQRLPAVEDAVIAQLRQRSSADLQAAGGMGALRRAIAASLDQILGPGQVQAVYFTQLVVQ
jgi:flagellar basal body-associated protein FliL